MTKSIQEPFDDSANPTYPDIADASHYDDLVTKINGFVEDVTDDQADVFLGDVNAAFSRLKLSNDNRIEILSLIQDLAHSSPTLYDKANNQACTIIDKMEGLPPSSMTPR